MLYRRQSIYCRLADVRCSLFIGLFLVVIATTGCTKGLDQQAQAPASNTQNESDELKVAAPAPETESSADVESGAVEEGTTQQSVNSQTSKEADVDNLKGGVKKETSGRPPMVVEYVPQTAKTVIAFRPKTLFTSQLFGVFAQPVAALFNKELLTGIQPADVDQITLVNTPYSWSKFLIIVRSDEKRDWIEYFRKVMDGKLLPKQLDAQRSYYEIPIQKSGVNHIYQIDGQTAVIGSEVGILKSALATKELRPDFLNSDEWELGQQGDLVLAGETASLMSFVKRHIRAQAPFRHPVVKLLEGTKQLIFSLDSTIEELDTRLSLKFENTAQSMAGYDKVNSIRADEIKRLKRKIDTKAISGGDELEFEVLSLITHFLENLEFSSTINTLTTSSEIQFTPQLVQKYYELQALILRHGSTYQSRQNLKQIAFALHNFHDSHLSFPAALLQNQGTKSQYSWRVALLPYLGQEEIYNQYNFDEPWDSEQNKKLLNKMPPIYSSQGEESARGMTRYLGIVGPDTVITSKLGQPNSGRPGTRISRILDGTANTIMVVEAAKAVPWTKPEDISFEMERGFDPLKNQLSNQFLALMTNGAIHFLDIPANDEKKQKLLLDSFTYAGGESVFIDLLLHASDLSKRKPYSRPQIRIPEKPESKVHWINGHLGKIGRALTTFHRIHSAFPPASVQNPDSKARHSWRVAILPMLGQQRLYHQYNFDEPWDSEQNKKLLEQIPEFYVTDEEGLKTGMTSILAVVGSDTVISSDQPTGDKGREGTRMADITDGTSNTAMIVYSKHEVPWTKPEDIPFESVATFDASQWFEIEKPQFLLSNASVFTNGLPSNRRKIQLLSKDKKRVAELFTRNGGESQVGSK